MSSVLWHAIVSYAACAEKKLRGKSSIFADDLNVFQEFDRTIANEQCKKVMYDCRLKVHNWGKVNRVVFDADKEHVIILHPLQGEGDPFKLLGCLVDLKLTMQQAIDKLLSQIRPKVKVIVRTRMHYTEKDLIS